MIRCNIFLLFQFSKHFNGLFNGQFIYESDNEFVDFYSYLEKIRQHSPLSLPVTLPFVSSIRKSSARLEINPAMCELKKATLKIKLCKYICIQKFLISLNFILICCKSKQWFTFYPFYHSSHSTTKYVDESDFQTSRTNNIARDQIHSILKYCPFDASSIPCNNN